VAAPLPCSYYLPWLLPDVFFSSAGTLEQRLPFYSRDYLRRRSGNVQVDNAWLEIFREFKDTASTFKLNITPEDLRIQRYGRTAIVTFHLGKGEKFFRKKDRCHGQEEKAMENCTPSCFNVVRRR
jgi:hypothetical protein